MRAITASRPPCGETLSLWRKHRTGRAPDAFDAIRVHVADHPHLRLVINGLMAGVVVGNAQIGAQFVGRFVRTTLWGERFLP